MDAATAHQLNAINRAFYEAVALDFDATRGSAWPGWLHLLPWLPSLDDGPLAVLDVGCGNGRFATFLADHLPGPLSYHGLDNSRPLLQAADSRLAGRPTLHARLDAHDVLHDPLPDARYHLIVAFGLLHHVPGWANRAALVQRMAARLAPGGVLAFTAWRFLEIDRLRERLLPWPDDLAGRVEPGDHLLDWRRGVVARRYCHHIDEAEQDALVAQTGLVQIARYRADGHQGTANAYSVLRRDDQPA